MPKVSSTFYLVKLESAFKYQFFGLVQQFLKEFVARTNIKTDIIFMKVAVRLNVG